MESIESKCKQTLRKPWVFEHFQALQREIGEQNFESREL